MHRTVAEKGSQQEILGLLGAAGQHSREAEELGIASHTSRFTYYCGPECTESRLKLSELQPKRPHFWPPDPGIQRFTHDQASLSRTEAWDDV